jgi:hypothetical protein
MTCFNWSASPKPNADRICAACSLPMRRSTGSAIAACHGQCSIERQTRQVGFRSKRSKYFDLAPQNRRLDRAIGTFFFNRHRLLPAGSNRSAPQGRRCGPSPHLLARAAFLRAVRNDSFQSSLRFRADWSSARHGDTKRTQPPVRPLGFAIQIGERALCAKQTASYRRSSG